MAAKVRIYTTTYCGYCRMAKRLLAEKGVVFDEVDVTDDPDMRARLVRETGRRTVPQIFIQDRPIGGFAELQALDTRGALEPLLADA